MFVSEVVVLEISVNFIAIEVLLVGKSLVSINRETVFVSELVVLEISVNFFEPLLVDKSYNDEGTVFVSEVVVLEISISFIELLLVDDSCIEE